MKSNLISSTLILVFCCSCIDKSTNTDNSNHYKVDTNITSIDTIPIPDTPVHTLTGKTITITVSYAAIACSCPQWFETKYQDVPFLEGVERYYLESTNTSLVNANRLWDGTTLPLTVKLTGQFSKEKELPITYHTKGSPEKARIFWYDKITVVSSSDL
jgi:hypothetical protein